MKRLAIGGISGLAAVLALATSLWAAKVPDQIVLTVPQGQKAQSTWIKKVEFDHAMHKDMVACTRCHHMDTEDTKPEAHQACRECHADSSSKGPDSFYSAWHANKPASCVSCHKEMGATISCTNGCHKRPGAQAKAGKK